MYHTAGGKDGDGKGAAGGVEFLSLGRHVTEHSIVALQWLGTKIILFVNEREQVRADMIFCLVQGRKTGLWGVYRLLVRLNFYEALPRAHGIIIVFIIFALSLALTPTTCIAPVGKSGPNL